MSPPVPMRAIDRTGWAAGPWDTEPDRLQWRTKAGYAGLIVRNELGALCGYVGVPTGHPAHGKGYDDVGVSVHGGLTYAHECQGYICHVPEPGQPDELYWLGFDCAHFQDKCPGSEARMRSIPNMDALPRLYDDYVYRDLQYVRGEVESLARQLKVLAHDQPVPPE